MTAFIDLSALPALRAAGIFFLIIDILSHRRRYCARRRNRKGEPLTQLRSFSEMLDAEFGRYECNQLIRKVTNNEDTDGINFP